MQGNEWVSFSYTINKFVGLREMVECVEKEEVDHLWSWDLHFRKHVESSQTSKTESGFLVQVGQCSNAPS